MAAIVQCMPNFSEGRRLQVIEAIAGAAAATPGARLLGVAPDPDHNRTVVSLIGSPEAVLQAVRRAAEAAVRLIDLREHRGSHPRMGAIDAVPWLPIGGGATLDLCVELARRLGQMLAGDLAIPVYLYGAAATRSDRENLADVRRGEFEGLLTAITEPGHYPDFGAPRLHPTAGATGVGARLPMITYRVTLQTRELAAGEAIALALGQAAPVIKPQVALGADRLVQLQMQLTDTPLHEAFALSLQAAQQHGVQVAGSEIVGSVPLSALVNAAVHSLRLQRFEPEQVLEQLLIGLDDTDGV